MTSYINSNKSVSKANYEPNILFSKATIAVGQLPKTAIKSSHFRPASIGLFVFIGHYLLKVLNYLGEEAA